VSAAWHVGPGRLERRGVQGLAQQVGQLGGAVDVENDGAGSAGVQRDAVIGAREPRCDYLGVAAGLALPAAADDTAGVFAGVHRVLAGHGQHVPACLGVGQRGGQHVHVVGDLGDGQCVMLGVIRRQWIFVSRPLDTGAVFFLRHDAATPTPRGSSVRWQRF